MLSSALTVLAYLDPGTGNIIIQVLLGGLAGAVVVIKLYWDKFKSLFTRRENSTAVTKEGKGDGGPSRAGSHGGQEDDQGRNGDL